MAQLNPALLADKPEILELLALLDAKDSAAIAQRDGLLRQLIPKIKPYSIEQLSLDVQDVGYQSRDGYQLVSRLYWPTKLPHDHQAIVLYIHGGGLISGTVDAADQSARDFASLAKAPVLSLDYRLAPQNNASDDLVQDVFSGLQWTVEQAEHLGLDVEHIQLVGVSAGGCLAAGVIPLAQAHNIAINQLMLIYPMLDDATINEQPDLVGLTSWTPQMNRQGWQSLLKDHLGDVTLPSTVVPMHTQDYAIFPTTYIEVGDCDIFASEDQQFAANLKQTGVSTELHVYAGLPHAFESFGAAAYLPAIYQNRSTWLLKNK